MTTEKELKDEIERLRGKLEKAEDTVSKGELKLKKAAKDLAKAEEAKLKAEKEAKEVVEQKVVVNSPRRLESFRGKPVHSTDPTIEEWIRDFEVHLKARNLVKEEAVNFVLDHLAANQPD